MKLYDGGLTFLILLALFGYTISVFERTEVDGKLDKDVMVDRVVDDYHNVKDEVSQAWEGRKPLDYSKLNK